MLPSLRVANAHRPLIHFLGKRQWPSKLGEQHPHPFAPNDLKEHFADFVKKFQTAASASSSSGATPAKKSSSSNGPVFEEFWQAPARLWKRDLADWEIDLVHSGGASARR